MRHAYAAARQTSEEGFQRSMDLMGESAPTSRDELSALPHTTWAHYGGRKNACWNHVTTNTAECSNSILREVCYLSPDDFCTLSPGLKLNQ